MFNLFKKYNTQILCIQWGSNIAFNRLISSDLCDRSYTLDISDDSLMDEIQEALQYKIKDSKEWFKIKKHLLRKLAFDYHVRLINKSNGMILYYYLGKE